MHTQTPDDSPRDPNPVAGDYDDPQIVSQDKADDDNNLLSEASRYASFTIVNLATGELTKALAHLIKSKEAFSILRVEVRRDSSDEIRSFDLRLDRHDTLNITNLMLQSISRARSRDSLSRLSV